MPSTIKKSHVNTSAVDVGSSFFSDTEYQECLKEWVMM